MPIKAGGVAPVLLPAVAGMFLVSLLDAAGMIPSGSPLTQAIYYGLFGACGGIAVHAFLRWLKRP